MAIVQTLLELKWLVASIIGLIYVVKKIQAYNRLKAFKGPFSTGLFNLWNCSVLMSPQMDQIYRKACQKYGTITRIGPNDLLTNSPELLAHISAARNHYSRTPWFYTGLRILRGTNSIFNVANEEEHSKRRHQMAPGYSGKENLDLEAAVDSQVVSLIQLIATNYATQDEPKPMDLARKVQFFTLDAITDIGFGQAYGFLEQDADVGNYLQQMELGFHLSVAKAALGLERLMDVPVLANFLWPSEKDKKGFGRVIALARPLIEQRQQQHRDSEKEKDLKDNQDGEGEEKKNIKKKGVGLRYDMLASFIRHGITGPRLLSEVLFQLVAGSDTTATSLRSVLLHLLTNPAAYKRLQAEIDTFSKGLDSSSSSSDDITIITDAVAKDLPYLHAVIREGMRMTPPVVMPQPKRVPPGGDTVIVDGEEILLPGGTNINQCGLGMHRSTAVYGEDADVYRPERWLEPEETEPTKTMGNEKERETQKKKMAQMMRVSDLMFGSGKFQCLGKPIAQMELRKVIFELIRRFDWHLDNPDKPYSSACFMGIFVQTDMWVTVTPRQASVE